uniref:Uncharacterized protein n=1 Tax=Human herpesvirus 1 TaxID=10298 RepID=A0A2U9A958_HHV1|nr:hypothetical protein [Human alphaherpesvirus 1]
MTVRTYMAVTVEADSRVSVGSGGRMHAASGHISSAPSLSVTAGKQSAYCSGVPSGTKKLGANGRSSVLVASRSTRGPGPPLTRRYASPRRRSICGSASWPGGADARARASRARRSTSRGAGAAAAPAPVWPVALAYALYKPMRRWMSSRAPRNSSIAHGARSPATASNSANRPPRVSKFISQATLGTTSSRSWALRSACWATRPPSSSTAPARSALLAPRTPWYLAGRRS